MRKQWHCREIAGIDLTGLPWGFRQLGEILMKLTKRAIDGLRAGDRECFWDDDLPGFGLRVYPSGRKVFVVQYKVGGRGGRTRRKTVGLYGPMTPTEARTEAGKWLGRGGDPITKARAEAAAEAQAVTVAQLCDQYLDALGKGLVLGKGGRPKKSSTISTDRGRIARHIKPLLGKRRVRDLTAADIARFIRDVTLGKTAVDERTGRYGRARVTGGAGTATRTTGLLSGVLSFARQEGLRSDNPAHGVRKPAAGRRDRRLTADDYSALGDALTAFEREGGNPMAAAQIRLLALTGCRLGEVVGLRQAEIDRRGHALRLGDTKTGASTRPLGGAALAVLEGLEDDPVFPAARRGSGHYGGLRNAFRAIVASRPLLERVTPHVLRHSFASVAADLGYTELTINAMTGHSSGRVTERYVHHLDAVLVAAADHVAGAIAAQMAGRPGADVVPLRPAAG
jgi:integrase